MDIEKILNTYIEEKRKKDDKKHAPPPDNRFHASSALCCPRQEYFNRRDPKPFNASTLKVFEMGHIIHEFVQGLLPGERRQ